MFNNLCELSLHPWHGWIGVCLKFDMLDFVLCLLCLYQQPISWRRLFNYTAAGSESRWGGGRKQALLGGRKGIYLGSADWQNLKDNFQNSEGALLLKPIGCGAFSKYWRLLSFFIWSSSQVDREGRRVVIFRGDRQTFAELDNFSKQICKTRSLGAPLGPDF